MSRLLTVTLGLILISAPAFAMSEKEFVSDAIKGDNSEIAVGQLALNNAGSEAARSLAQTLIDDHLQNRTQAEAVASSLGVTPPSQPTAEAEQEMAKLSKLKGAEFDRAFARYMVKDYEKDIAMFKSQAGNSPSPAQQLASQSLPVLEKHLAMAKQLESATASETRTNGAKTP